MKSNLFVGVSALALCVSSPAVVGQTLVIDTPDHNGVDAVGYDTLINQSDIDQTEGTENLAGAVIMSEDFYSLVNYGTITATTGRGITSVGVVNADTVLNYGEIYALDRTAIWVTGDVNEVLNDGGIFTAGPTAAGIVVEGSAGSITNYRLITTDHGNGIVSTSRVGEVLNTGLIAAYGVGILVNQADTIENTGAIISQGFTGIGANGAVGEIRNSGSITATEHGIQAGYAGWLINSGTIDAGSWGVLLGADAYMQNSGTIRGGKIGVGINGGDLLGGGTLINSGTIAVEDGPDALYAVQMFAKGYAGATLTNSGTIVSEASGPTSTAVLIEDTFGWPYSSGYVINSGTIGGAAQAIEFSYIGVATLDLLTGSRIFGAINFRDDYSDSLIDFSEFAGNTVLDVKYLDAIEPGDRNYVWDNTDRANARLAIFDISGIAGGAIANGLTDVVLAANGVLGSMSGGAGEGIEPSAYAPTASGEAETAVLTALDTGATSPQFWISSFGGGSNAGMTQSGFGGLLGGVQFDVDTMTVGVTGGASMSVTTSLPQQELETRTFLLGFYGQTDLGPGVVTASLLGGYSLHESTREVVANNAVEEASASFSSLFVAPSLGFSMAVLSSEQDTLSVEGTLTYVGGLVAGYTETGSSMNLSVGEQNIGLVDARLGLAQTHREGDVTLKVKAGLFAQNNVGTSAVPVTLFGQTTTASTAGGLSLGGYAGLGLGMELGQADLSFSLDGMVRNDGTSSGSAKVKFGSTF